MIARATLQPGQQVVFSYWGGFGRPIPCTVIKVGPVKVKIRIQGADGQDYESWVKLGNLFRTAHEAASVYEVLR